MDESPGFELLHEAVRRWVWKQNWPGLRDIQERAIGPVLEARRDIVISAATASGKTEAAFLPACSKLVQEPADGLGLLYVSPLKALINDQFRRLQGLCDSLELPLTPWHGDVPQGLKNRRIREPRGVVLITPESLEALLLNRGAWSQAALAGLRYVIIDEFHAFLGTERGRQLQSLLHRLDFLLGRAIPRIALSATLGDMEQVARELRPRAALPCEMIVSTASRSEVRLQLRGYTEPAGGDASRPGAFERLADDLFKMLRGRSNLIFANSRAGVEELAAALAGRGDREQVPNEFFPHHGSLARELREELEKRLQAEKLPTTAVCTMTLELGLDIGRVDSVAQVAAPNSVASLRQRLGRSGRRGDAAALRLFITENDPADPKNHLADRLRLEIFQSAAMVNLLIKKWYEPADTGQYHFSTLVQQTLSVVGHYGGVRAEQLWNLLCGSGPFGNVDQKNYALLLRALGEQDLLSQTRDGLLVLGVRGERLVGHFTFYTAFSNPEEYRLEHKGKILGSLPVSRPLALGQLLVFAGKFWEVALIAESEKLISLKPAAGGRPPSFAGGGLPLHDAVRREMYRLYSSDETPSFCNREALGLFEEGRRSFNELGLKSISMLEYGGVVNMLPWLGDKTVNTVVMLLRSSGLKADSESGVIYVREADIAALRRAIKDILASPRPQGRELAAGVPNTFTEKHDAVVPKELRELNYAAKFFDLDGAWRWMSGLDSD